MKKIENFDKVQESTSFKRLAPDAYVCKIVNVEDHPDKEYLKIYFDIAEGDNKGYFSNLYKTDTRPDKKWANAGTFIRSYKESALPMFKGFTNALEKSNKGYKWDWDEKKLKGKVIVLIIGEEEYMNQKGQKRVRNYVNAIRSVEAYKAGDFTIPELKKLDESKTVTTSTPADFEDPFGDAEVPNTTTKATVVNDNPWGDDDDDSPFGD